MRTILALPITILFFPIAIILSLGLAFIYLPEMLIDCFQEVSGRTNK